MDMDNHGELGEMDQDYHVIYLRQKQRWSRCQAAFLVVIGTLLVLTPLLILPEFGYSVFPWW